MIAWTTLGAMRPAATTPPRRFEQKPFTLPASGEPARAPRPGIDLGEAPPSIRACLALATDVEGILAVEELARETLRRLVPFAVQERPSIVWSFVPSWPGADQGGEFIYSAVHMSLQQAASDQKDVASMRRASFAGSGPLDTHLTERVSTLLERQLCQRFVDACGFASMWEMACELGLHVPTYEAHPGVVVPAAGQLFRDLANPFEPILAIMERGYWLSGTTEDAILLMGTEFLER